jgi:hypothetical protein
MFPDPFRQMMQIVIVAHGKVAGGRAIGQALLLHPLQVLFIKLGIPYSAPVMLIANEVKLQKEDDGFKTRSTT